MTETKETTWRDLIGKEVVVQFGPHESNRARGPLLVYGRPEQHANPTHLSVGMWVVTISKITRIVGRSIYSS